MKGKKYMVNEIFLTTEEKEKLSQRHSDCINDAVEKSDKILQKIIQKRLLPVKEKIIKDTEYYLGELSRTEKEITAEIRKDEASSPSKRLKNWGKIQAIRDKAYTLHTNEQSISDYNQRIKKFDITDDIISLKEDRETRKCYNAIFNSEQIFRKVLEGTEHKIKNALLFINKFLDVFLIIVGFLLYVNIFSIFGIANNNPDTSPIFLMVILFFALALYSILPILLILKFLKPENIITLFTYVVYIINLVFLLYGKVLLLVEGEVLQMSMQQWVIFLIIVLILFLSRICLSLFTNSYIKHYNQAYKQYYDFLNDKQSEIRAYAVNLLEEKIDTLKESYCLDFSSFSKAEEIYSSILNKYDTWAKNHSVIPSEELLSNQPKLDHSRISSRIEKTKRRCPRCGCRYYSTRNYTCSHGETKRRECVSGGYYKDFERNYDIKVDGTKVGTVTEKDSYYVSPEYKDVTYERKSRTSYDKCRFCGYEFNEKTTTEEVKKPSAEVQLAAINKLLDAFEKNE